VRRLIPLFVFAVGACLVVLLFTQSANANTISTCTTVAEGVSCTGTLDTAEDVFLQTFTLGGASTITVQTYGFGGGTNAAGTAVSAGGFDSLVALFSAPVTNANILMSGGNPLISGDSVGLFYPGCPPAGKVMVGTISGICGDNLLTAALGPGLYTLLLSDSNFQPLAVNPGLAGPFDLTDTTSMNYGSPTNNGAYFDFSGGAFQTCASSTDCNTDNGNFAVDILATSGPSPVPTPEPAGLALLPAAFMVLDGLRRATRLRRFPIGCAPSPASHRLSAAPKSL
jgi:hypothetical protein